jgi:hypothetical protein
MSLWKYRLTAPCDLSQNVSAFSDPFQAGKVYSFYESASQVDAQRNASHCNHPIGIRMEDKIKCLWLCVRCKERTHLVNHS